MSETEGFVHLYFGEGKGKTTAAAGLALRALGRGKRVRILQFLKDGTSGEIALLKELGAEVSAGKTGGGFVSRMSKEEQAEVRVRQDRLLQEAIDSGCDLLVLDEACAACRMGLVDEELLKRAVLEKPEEREVILTGRGPADWMKEAADYVTEMRCVKHPFAQGVTAREGVEY